MTRLLQLLLCLFIVISLPACTDDSTTPDFEYTPNDPDTGDNNGDQDNENNGENEENGDNEGNEGNEGDENDDNENEGDSSLEHVTIEIPNGDFEDYVDFTGQKGAWKKGNAWYTSRATFSYLESGGVNNSACIKISCLDGNNTTDAPAVQTISGLSIGVPYELSADIKTQGVEKGRGGSIGIFEWSGFIASAAYTGTNGWSNRKVLFVPETEEVEVCCRLGFWGGDSRGTVWFDNVKLETPQNIYTRQSEHIILYLYNNLVTVSNSTIDEWLTDLDTAYEAYCDLFDFFKPYGGKKMPIISNEVSAWAIAGYPIQWNPKYVASTLKDVATHDDSVFGILHEIAHNFGPDNYTTGNYDKGNDNWNWNEELFANFRMYYALDKHNMKIYTDGKVFVGTEIATLKYSKDSASSWSNNKDLDGAGMMWPLCQMVADVGWEPFKKAFNELYNMNPNQSCGSTKWEKISYFLNVVSKHADKDMLSYLTTSQKNKLKDW